MLAGWLAACGIGGLVLAQSTPGVTPSATPWSVHEWSKCHAMPGCPGAICDPFYDMQPGGWCVSCTKPTPQSYCGGAWLPWSICIMGDPGWPGNHCGQGINGTCDPLTLACVTTPPPPGSPVLYCTQLQCSRGSIPNPGGIDP